MAKGYNNHLQWNEVAKFKADLMNATARWRVINPEVFKSTCLREGMREVDAEELTGYLRRRLEGKRLVPFRSYKAHRFPAPIDASPKVENIAPSRDW